MCKCHWLAPRATSPGSLCVNTDGGKLEAGGKLKVERHLEVDNSYDGSPSVDDLIAHEPS